jgi:hypothetical protein
VFKTRLAWPSLVIALSEYRRADRLVGQGVKATGQTAASLPCRPMASKVVVRMTTMNTTAGDPLFLS